MMITIVYHYLVIRYFKFKKRKNKEIKGKHLPSVFIYCLYQAKDMGIFFLRGVLCHIYVGSSDEINSLYRNTRSPKY